ncbi:MAG TPA: glycosyltransferase [Lacipirellulaceae bacterium]|nr:glycosyltransferase [Lacipirellulaceae bacterium]
MPSTFDGPAIVQLPVRVAAAETSRDVAHELGTTTATQSIFALHLVNGEHYSGAERVQDLLARQLPTFGCDVGFVCVKPQLFPNARETKTAPLIEMPMRSRFDLRVVKRISEMVRSDGYDLIHSHTPRTALVGRLAAHKAEVPFIYHVHSPAGRDSTRRLFNWINAAAEWMVVRGADRLIAVSPSVRDYMIARGIADRRIVYVPNGVPACTSRADRDAPTGSWNLGVVALFRPRKGIEVLLEALATLRSRGVDVRLRVVGGFETPLYQAVVCRLADRLGVADAVDWIGFTRNIDRELAKIDLFVLPSLFGEGLPMVVLEAMAAGLPVIASRVEGVPEAVIHRRTGLLVDPGSVSQLAQAIEEFVSGNIDYEALSRGAQSRHAEFFSDSAMAAGVAGVYRDVLATMARD